LDILEIVPTPKIFNLERLIFLMDYALKKLRQKDGGLFLDLDPNLSLLECPGVIRGTIYKNLDECLKNGKLLESGLTLLVGKEGASRWQGNFLIQSNLDIIYFLNLAGVTHWEKIDKIRLFFEGERLYGVSPIIAKK
jgi:hypothetical protein